MFPARSRYLISAGVVAVLLTACRAPQSPLSPLASSPQTHRIKQGGNYKSIYSFAGPPDGAQPAASVILDGEFYGTTSLGGNTHHCPNGCGTVFRVTAQGREHAVYRFKGTTDGANPQAGLTEFNGELFGTTYAGGNNACSGGCGVIFKIELGREHTVYSFKGGSDGAHPKGTMVAVNGTLYGTTYSGGGGDNGTFFAVTPSGQENVVYTFRGAPNDGAHPVGTLAAASGALYGVTERGGYQNAGMIFHIQPSGPESIVHSFDPANDGETPTGLVNFPNSDTMYGTATAGGTYGLGTMFLVLPNTSFRTFYSFRGRTKSDGASPAAPPTVVNDRLYGTTRGGGTHGNGTIYELDPYTSGESVLYNFGQARDGAHPVAPLLDDNGVLYGTTMNGGSHGGKSGTVFSIEEK